MIIISYDFSDNKRRAKFSRFLEQYGERLQYSVFSIKNSRRILNIVLTEIDKNYKNYFTNTDSIIIWNVCEICKKKIIRYGSSSHDMKDIIYFS